MNDPDENNKFFRNMAGRIALIETDIERENYIVVLSERYNVPADSLRELIRNVAASDKEMRDIREEFYSGVNGADVRGPDDAAGDESEARPTRQMSIKAKSDAGLKETEGILLTWLFEDPTLYSSIATYISPDDFQEGLYREIATDMFNAYSGANNDTSGFDPAALMCKFEDNEAHKTIASMLHTKIDGIESDEEREVLLKETLIKLKQEGLKNIDKSKPGSGKRIMQIKNDIRQLQSSNLL